MSERFDVVMASPLPGNLRIGLRFGEAGLAEAEWLPSEVPLRRPRNGTQRKAVEQLRSYLRDGNTRFEFPLELHGTPHQLRVWRALLAIPPGQVRSYGDVARALHSSAQAVGNACRTNPMAIVVPCHRVVGANGLGGYMGASFGGPLAVKQWLLRHEGAL